MPTPWTLLRYVPVIGAARMPQRMVALVMSGLPSSSGSGSGNCAAGCASRRVHRAPQGPSRLVAAVLVFEMRPAPRVLYSAEVPSINRPIAADPRPCASSICRSACATASARTAMRAPRGSISRPCTRSRLGGYVSRLPRRKVQLYRRFRVTRVLLDLSEGRAVPWWRRDAAMEQAHELAETPGLVRGCRHRRHVSRPHGICNASFRLTRVASDGPYVLHLMPLAPPSLPPLVPQIIEFWCKAVDGRRTSGDNARFGGAEWLT